MYNNIWDQRYVALEALLESLGMTEELADRIKENFSEIEENVPERFVGYVDSLLKYAEQLSALWGSLYSEEEYQEALNNESPKLIIPPSISIDETGTPTSSGQQFALAVTEDSEGNTIVEDPSQPGYSQENDINIGWFGNLVNTLNNYVPENTKAWHVVWNLIKEGIGIANGFPTIYTKQNIIGTGTSSSLNYLPLAWSGNREAYKAEPVPEFIDRPDDTDLVPDQEVKQCVHEQVFVYGDHTVVFRLYNTDEAVMVEVKFAPMATTSSIPALPQIGTALVNADVTPFDDIRVPILSRKDDCFAFSHIYLCITRLYGYPGSCLRLTVEGLKDPDSDAIDTTMELASNTTYTSVQIVNPDMEYKSSTELGNWQITAKVKGELITYSSEYLGDTTPPVPPDTDHVLDAYNIGTAVFNEIRANRYGVTKEQAHHPTEEGTGDSLTYENIETGSYDKVITRKLTLTKEAPHPPTIPANPDHPLKFDNISSAILEEIKAQRFIVSHDTNKPEGIEFIPQKAPNPYDYFAFNFTQYNVDFNVSYLINQQLPGGLSPSTNLATFLFGNNKETYGDGTVSEGDVDMLGYFSIDGTLPFMGLYAYNGDQTYNRVYNYDDTVSVAMSTDLDPVWKKIADRFTLSIYQAGSFLIYSFEATYKDNGLESWTSGTHKIVTEGEMPRNCMPQSHIICPVGKFCFLTFQSNGAVRLTVAHDEVVQLGLAYNCIGITEKRDQKKFGEKKTSLTIPPRAVRGRRTAPLKTEYIPKTSEGTIIYEWAGMQLRNLTVNSNGGIKALSYIYDLDNLRAPIRDTFGGEICSNEQVRTLLDMKSSLRIRTGDNVLLKIISITSETIPEYQQYYTGKHVFLFSVCEFIWMRPQIKFVVNALKESVQSLRNLVEDWDGIKKSDYFVELTEHRKAIATTAEYSQNILAEFNRVQSGGRNEIPEIVTAGTGIYS